MDLAVIESLNGGDLVKNPKDLAIIQGFQNMPYLAMFGGSVKQSTPPTRIASQQAYDFWGNNLLWPNDASIQMNSETERALNNIPLTSAGRVLIENAINEDMQVMKSFANIAVEVSVTGPDRIEWFITITKPDNLQSTQFIYIWDATISELSVLVGSPGNAVPFDSGIFDFSFDFTFE